MGQEQDPEVDLEQMIENFGEVDEETDFSPLVDDLCVLSDSPLDLNEASTEDLEALGLLTDLQMENFIKYRRRSGKLLSIYELQSIDGFDDETIEAMLPWVCLANSQQPPKLSWRKAWKYKKQQILFRSQWVNEEQAGYSAKNENRSASYPGNKYKLYAKYKLYYKQQVKLGITAEKDPGEQFFAGKQKNGFDFYSAYLQVRKLGPFENIVIGDFECKMGQGLVCSSGLSLGKSSMVMNIRRKAQGLKGYTSSDENSFMRGAGASVKWGKCSATAFASYKKRDANLLSDSAMNATSFSAFQSSGLHATEAETTDKKAVGESILGLQLNYEFKNARIGANYMAYRYSLPMNREIKAYNQYEFNGQSNQNASFDYFVNRNHFQFFGEAAISTNGGKAMLNGLTVEANDRLRFSCLHRIYEKDYQSLYGKAFGEGSKNANEKGFFFGIELLPMKKISINAYFDVFQFDWLRYQVSAPSEGYEFFGLITYLVSKTSKLSLKLHVESKAKDYHIDQTIKTENYTKNSYRINYDYQPLENIRCRNRLEWLKIEQAYGAPQKGFVFFQDVNYRFARLPITASLHYAIFDTDDWESRIYAYEQDILYGFSIPAYYMKGTRSCLTIKYAIGTSCNLWFRAAQTQYSNLSTIGSGDTEIQGSHKTDFKIQLQVKF